MTLYRDSVLICGLCGFVIFMLSYMRCGIAVLGQLPLRVRANSFCHCSVAFVSVCVCGCACLGGRLDTGGHQVCAWVCVPSACVLCVGPDASRWVKPHHPLKVGAYTFSDV